MNFLQGVSKMKKKKIFITTISVLMIIYVAFSIIISLQQKEINELEIKLSNSYHDNSLLRQEKIYLNRKKETLELIYDEYNFYHAHSVICDDNSKYYHKYDCTEWDNNAFYIYNYEQAINLGYESCPECY